MNLWVEAPHTESTSYMFEGHWSITSGDIKYLMSCATQKHAIEGSSTLMSGSSSWCHYFTKFGGHKYYNNKDNIFSLSSDQARPHVNPNLGGFSIQ